MIVLSVVLSDCCKSKSGCRDWAFSNSSFSCPCSQNVTHCRKKNCSTCLSKWLSTRSPCLLWNQSLQSLLYQKREVPESGSTLHQQCTMVASCLEKRELRYPRFGLQDIDCDLGCFTYATLGDCWKSMKNCRDWAFSNTGFGSGAASLSAADHGVVVSKICYVWLCSQLCYQTAANPRTVVEIELLAIVLSAAHVRKMWRTAERRIARHVCVRHPLRPFHFGIPSSLSAVSTRRRFLRATVRSVPIPSLHLQKNEPVSRREAKRLVKQLWSPKF